MTEAKDKLGEWSPVAPVTDEVENICIEAGKEAGVHFDVCIPETFRVQRLCGGTFYLVKVKVGEDKYLHVMIHRPSGIRVPTDISVRGVKYPKLKADLLDPSEHF